MMVKRSQDDFPAGRKPSPVSAKDTPVSSPACIRFPISLWPFPVNIIAVPYRHGLLKMDFDSLAKEQSDRVFQVWIQNLLRNSPEDLAGRLASRHCSGTPVTASLLPNGAFNVCYRVTYENGHRFLVRFTALGRVIACNEKVEDEVSIMNYVAQHTTIPVPKVLGHGQCVVGPYIVMFFIEGRALSRYLRDSSQKTITLNSKVSMSILRRAYFSMAEVLPGLSKPEFPYIGAIRQDESGGWTVPKRPLTFNMNRLAQFSNIPHSVFGRQHFSNAAD